MSPSSFMIVCFNIRVDLKPKGMSNYRWCWFGLNLNLTKGMCYEVDLKYGGRDVSEGGLVSCCSKDDMARNGPPPSRSTNHFNFVIFGLTNLKLSKGKVLVSCE